MRGRGVQGLAADFDGPVQTFYGGWKWMWHFLPLYLEPRVDWFALERWHAEPRTLKLRIYASFWSRSEGRERDETPADR